ncbi:hypothetical protein SAMN02745245_00328 [Anaerosphaera aminiphila DSM 21120]|uniref:Membrane-spanning protein n=1 Tax=Anaerosphaera aminiphila DSM 21120 TaxID=1120995 RepID=A0A1M5PI68_9FIRM|nr:hypothetical protein [Anaerosphaera aminiphila]SHH01189.1 hypothetical protein SAMN02745245_00328 [Anaerosphaera aminiphila DSM 21120]
MKKKMPKRTAEEITDKRKTLIFKIVFTLLALSVVYAIINFIKAPSGVSNKEYELVKSDYVLMILQCLVGMVIIFLPSRVEKKYGIDIPDIMEIIYFIFLFCAIYLGEVRNFYYKVPYWDVILHVFSAIMLGALGFVIVDFFNNYNKLHLNLSPFFVSLFAFCFALTCGVVWEIYEYLADHILRTNMQKFMTASGEILCGHAALGDTMKDIIVDFIGALFIVVIGFIHLKKEEKKKEENKQA